MQKKPPRILEILPGAFSFTVITFPAWGSLFIPQIVAYFIVAFDVFWLYKSISLGVIATISHFRMRASMANDWVHELEQKEHFAEVNHLIIIPTYKEPLSTLQATISHLQKQDYPGQKLHIVQNRCHGVPLLKQYAASDLDSLVFVSVR